MNFNLICNVKKKAHPLTLNVKAEGYSVKVEVKCKDRVGAVTLLTPNQTTTINFYEVKWEKASHARFAHCLGEAEPMTKPGRPGEPRRAAPSAERVIVVMWLLFFSQGDFAFHGVVSWWGEERMLVLNTQEGCFAKN